MAGWKFIQKHECADSTTQYIRFTGLTTTSYSWIRMFVSGRGTATYDTPSRLRIGINSDYPNQSGGHLHYMGRDAGWNYFNNYSSNEFQSNYGAAFPQDGSLWSYNSGSNKSMGVWQLDLNLTDVTSTTDVLGTSRSTAAFQLGGIGGWSTNSNGGSGMGNVSGLISQVGFRWNNTVTPAAITKLTFDIDNNNWRQGSAVYLYGFEE